MRVWLNKRAKRGATCALGCLALFAHTQFASFSQILTNAIYFQILGERKARWDVSTAPRFARLLSC